MTAHTVPSEAETLKGRLRDCHRDYVKYIERRNAEANAHEGTIAALTNEIEKIDGDISNVEAYADTLERLLTEL
jgi:ribosome recycling factor